MKQDWINWHCKLKTSFEPPDVRAILAIWDFKQKRFPDGCINKHRARLCAHGGIQKYGVSYWWLIPSDLVTHGRQPL